MATRKPIPWLYTETKGFRTWTWETPQFRAKIIGEGASETQSISWQIIEKSDKGEFIFENSQSRNFREAELEVAETVAKSWDRKYGFTEFAGDLAYTFAIATGDRINFEPYIGERVRMTYSSNYDVAENKGLLGIKNYDVLLKQDDGKVVVIPPGAIREISKTQ